MLPEAVDHEMSLTKQRWTSACGSRVMCIRCVEDTGSLFRLKANLDPHHPVRLYWVVLLLLLLLLLQSIWYWIQRLAGGVAARAPVGAVWKNGDASVCC